MVVMARWWRLKMVTVADGGGGKTVAVEDVTVEDGGG